MKTTTATEPKQAPRVRVDVNAYEASGERHACLYIKPLDGFQPPVSVSCNPTGCASLGGSDATLRLIRDALDTHLGDTRSRQLQRLLAALSDAHASANDPRLKGMGGPDWKWTLRIMQDGIDALASVGIKWHSEQRFTANDLAAMGEHK